MGEDHIEIEILVLRKYQYLTIFILYLCNDHKVKPLHLMRAKMNAYVKSCDGQRQSQ